MNLIPRRWKLESLICGLREHVTPARSVAHLRDEDIHVGVEGPQPHVRFSRCLRCDAWLPGLDPEHPAREDLGDLGAIVLPRRGDALRQAVIMRLIAIDKAIHSLLFALAVVALLVIDLKLGGLHAFADRTLNEITGSGQPSSATFEHWLRKLDDLHHSEIRLLIAASVGYAVIEGVEAWGLWREKLWAEYLTVIATAALIPLEIYEIVHRVTPFKITAMVVNVAIVVWLIWAKRLFGIRGGHQAHEGPTALDLPRLTHEPAYTGVDDPERAGATAASRTLEG
jgi:uncharacterized membrane protein (DUF2068 family)